MSRAGSPALTVLHGAGGVGTTALALAWAHGRAANLPDGQLYVNLHGFGPGEAVDPVAALGEMLRALGVDRGQLPPGLAERAAFLRSTVSGRRILLLLDNARDEAQVRPLLPGSGGVVVVTSRNQLRGLAVGEGARRVAVNELPAVEAVELLAEVR